VSFELADELNGAIRLLALRHRTLTGNRIAELGLHPGQDVMLLALAEGDRTQSQLASAAGCESPSVTSMVRKLEAEGLVSRERGTDARTLVVTLTAKGEAVIPRLREIWIEIGKETVAHLTRTTPDEVFIAVRDLARSLSQDRKK
jgi:MarR family transcriptional regulator, organic hydroperoxide resistance regulator